MDRRLQGLDRALRHVLGIVPLRNTIQQHDEFVATHAGHRIGASRHATDAPRDLLQELIARMMAERVVDDFKAVQVEHRERKGPAVALRMGECLCQPIIQQDAVGQAGQGVMAREVAQLLVGGLEAFRAGLHHILECLDLAPYERLVVPLPGESIG